MAPHPTSRRGLAGLALLALTCFLVGLGDAAETDARRGSDRSPRRRVGVPLFIGPGRFELESTRTRRQRGWVEFGTRRVEVAWRIRAGRERCRVGLHIVSRSGRLERHRIVRVRARDHRRLRQTLRVNHATARLVVLSNCARYRLTISPIRDRRHPVSLRLIRYRVHGDRSRELWRSVRRESPVGWSAITQWRTHGRCGPVSIKVWLPRWRAPHRAPDWLVRRWRTYLHNLRVHERGHVTLVRQGIGRADGCLTRRDWAKISRRSDRYDRVTDHGRTQGVRWSS